jgi:hypothetical protein
MPSIVFSLIALFISLSQPVLFEVTTTLYLDKEKAESPLLKNITEADHAAILERTLKGRRVLKDTLQEVGLLLEGASAVTEQQTLNDFSADIELDVLNDHLIKISYESLSPQNIETTLETLSFNFIHEILAPERFRTEQQLASLAEQIKYYSEKIKIAGEALKSIQIQSAESKDKDNKFLKKIVSLEFDMEKYASQKRMAQEEYDHLLTKNKSLVSQYSQSPNAVLWFVEAPTMLPQQSNLERHIRYMLTGILLAVLLSIILIIYAWYSDRSLHTEEEFRRYLGVKVIGHMPNLGDVRTEDGIITANVRTSI